MNNLYLQVIKRTIILVLLSITLISPSYASIPGCAYQVGGCHQKVMTGSINFLSNSSRFDYTKDSLAKYSIISPYYSSPNNFDGYAVVIHNELMMLVYPLSIVILLVLGVYLLRRYFIPYIIFLSAFAIDILLSLLTSGGGHQGVYLSVKDLVSTLFFALTYVLSHPAFLSFLCLVSAMFFLVRFYKKDFFITSPRNKVIAYGALLLVIGIPFTYYAIIFSLFFPFAGRAPKLDAIIFIALANSISFLVYASLTKFFYKMTYIEPVRGSTDVASNEMQNNVTTK